MPLTPPMPVMGGVLYVPGPHEEALYVPGPHEEARRLAQENLQSALQQLTAAGVTADGEVSDDPMRAVQAAFSRRQFDEIIVSTLPERLSRWMRQDLPRRLQHKFRLPVTHVEATNRSSSKAWIRRRTSEQKSSG
jgi:GABA permease